MKYLHGDGIVEKWYKFSFAEQLGHIGSAVNRTKKWRDKDEGIFTRAVYRALELLDLTIADTRWRTGLKEFTRVRELLCDTAFGENQYHTSLEDLDRYFTKFALASRLDI